MTSSPDDETVLTGRLIERLLVDPGFRGEFRRDPVGACVAAGLPGLALELGAGGGLETLELRESRSSLAGVVMAAAVEAISLAEAQSVVEHGLAHGLGGKLPGGVKLPRALRGVTGAEHHLTGRVKGELGRDEHRLGLHGNPLHHATEGPSTPTSNPNADGATNSNGPAPGSDPPAASTPTGAGAPTGAGTPATGADPTAASAGSPATTTAAGVSAAGSGISAHAAAGSGIGAHAAAASSPPAAAASSPPAGQSATTAASTAGPGASSASAGASPIDTTPSSGSGASPVDTTPSASSGASPVDTTPTSANSGAAGYALPWPEPTTPASTSASAGDVIYSAASAGSASAPITPVGLQGLLTSPGLSAPAPIRTWLASGAADPRIITVLDSALAHHTIGIADAVSMSDPIHAQALDIVSVDGQPVGPDNAAARDLITEIAALNPTTRPDEIGTPWPIQSPGFFTDPQSQNCLHLAFEAPTTQTPDPTLNPAAPTAQPQELMSSSGGTTASPSTASGAATPTASGAATPTATGDALQPAVESAAMSGSASAAVAPAAHAALSAAERELGVPYQYGDESPGHGFDCSGLTQWAYHQAGITIPRVAADQFNAGKPVSISDLRPGDLVFFKITGGEVDHVGMYVGDHRFIEAPRTGENVQYASLQNPYWAQHLAGARRIVPLSASSTATGGTGTPTTTPGATTPASQSPTPTPGAVTPAAPTPATPGAGTTVPTTPTDPGTAQFRAVARHERVAALNTVKFLPAIQPSAAAGVAGQSDQVAESGLPPAGQPAAEQIGSSGHSTADQVGASDQPVIEEIGAQGQSGHPVSGGLAEQVGDQASAPAGSVVSVSSSLLTSGQETFAAHLASLTGLDPRVVAAWELAEESGGAAQGRQAEGNFDWLNIGYFDSGPGQIAFSKAFADPVTAAEATAKFLKGTWGGASESIQTILSAVSKGPNQQMMAIANSDWAGSHYDGGSELLGTYQELSDLKVQSAPAA